MLTDLIMCLIEPQAKVNGKYLQLFDLGELDY